MSSFVRLFNRYIGEIRTIFITLTIGATVVSASEGDGGHVLPPQARPHGYSLDRMVSALALFQTSGNNLSYYPFKQFPDPTRPFQVLYFPNQFNSQFTVYAGTMLYVPLVFVDDSPPILGDFPVNAKGAEHYFTSLDQLGGKNWRITVDDDTTPVGAEYFAGPAVQTNPPLLDGGGTHLYILGVFLTPLDLGPIPSRSTVSWTALRLVAHPSQNISSTQ